jgi:hypothetical protein
VVLTAMGPLAVRDVARTDEIVSTSSNARLSRLFRKTGERCFIRAF